MTGFVAELNVMIGAFSAEPVFAGLALVGIVVTAAYMLWMLQRLLLGPINAKWAEMKDADKREIWVIVPLMVLMTVFGVYPKPIMDIFEVASTAIIKVIGG
jgi:NADH-quinone oxidoreductase subunit M